jgi:hypothetical protein
VLRLYKYSTTTTTRSYSLLALVLLVVLQTSNDTTNYTSHRFTPLAVLNSVLRVIVNVTIT